MKQPLDAEEMLLFPRDFLLLLKETQLFGPMVDKAIEDIETFIKMNQTENPPRRILKNSISSGTLRLPSKKGTLPREVRGK